MIYCSIGPDSDIHLYRNIYGEFQCTTDSFYPKSYVEAYLHLLDHEEEGNKVPQKAYDRLRYESKELRTYVAGVFGIKDICCCEGKDWNCSELPGCVTQEEWNNLYLVPTCSK